MLIVALQYLSTFACHFYHSVILCKKCFTSALVKLHFGDEDKEHAYVYRKAAIAERTGAHIISMRLKFYFTANGVTSNVKKKSILLTAVRPDTFRKIGSILHGCMPGDEQATMTWLAMWRITLTQALSHSVKISLQTRVQEQTETGQSMLQLFADSLSTVTIARRVTSQPPSLFISLQYTVHSFSGLSSRSGFP